ncbi:MAG: tetratricopeptide repeat protein [Flavobacteriales bacterium]
MYIGKADEFGAMGQWPEALAMMNKADSLKPEDYSILHLRGKLKGHSGDHAGAVEDLDRAIDLCTVEKQRRILLLSRAGIHKKAGHLDLACSDWKLAGELGEFDYKEHCTQLEQGSGVQ